MITLNDVSFRYDESHDVLKHVSLNISKGDFVALIGHNGSGKSTLAKLINALLIPTEGDVIVDGCNTKDEASVWKIRQKAGMIFQNPDNQIVASIVEEDVAFGPENLGFPAPEIRSRVDKALAEVRMSEYIKRPPHMLSGGQKQRIAIAGVLAMEPDIVIFDEATSMLDPLGRRGVLEILKELHLKGITIVLITHFMEEAMKADTVHVMSEGAIVLSGTPSEIFRQEELLRSLNLEIPEVVEISNLLRREGLQIPEVSEINELAEVLCRLK